MLRFKFRIIPFSIIAITAILASYLYPHDDIVVPVKQVARASSATLYTAPRSDIPMFSSSDLIATNPVSHIPQHVVSRRIRMKSLMIGSPSGYDAMTLGELQQKARMKDADAMLQLAEQYLNEDWRIRSDPDYPRDQSTRELAKKYLADAFQEGRIRSAAILSKLYFDDNDTTNAYAWRIVSQKIGDEKNPLWGKDTNQFSSISLEDKIVAENEAAKRIDYLTQMIQASSAAGSRTN